MVTLGIDRIEEYSELFGNRKTGLITNYSGVNSELDEDMDVFARVGVPISRIFTPEHGLYGARDGVKVDNSEHPVYHVPIVSLYGAKVRPDPEDLEGLDLLIYDIQDVGLRYYTYIYTLANCMQTAADCGIPFLVLDRPNPLGGETGGNRMDPKFESFVGAHELALRYGLTPGEIGFYFKDYLQLDLDYGVIPMKGYRKDMIWPETGQLWNIPSPSIHTFHSILCYYGGCFFEATNISEGRGTAEPFQIYGAPFIDMDHLVKELRLQIHTPDLAIRKRAFEPLASKYKGETCFGVEFLPLSNHLDFLPVALITMRTILRMYPEQFEFHTRADGTKLSRLAGDTLADKYVEGKMELEELLLRWNAQAQTFAERVEPFRLYACGMD